MYFGFLNYLHLALETMQSPPEVSEPNTTDLLLRRFLYHMWRMDEAARGYAAVNNSEDKEMMQKRWEIGLTYELVRAPIN